MYLQDAELGESVTLTTLVNRDVSHTSKLLRVAAGGAATGVQSPHHQRTSEGARRSCSYFGE